MSDNEQTENSPNKSEANVSTESDDDGNKTVISSPSNSDLHKLLKQIVKDQCTKSDLKKMNEALSKNIESVQVKANTNEASISELKKRLTRMEERQASAQYDSELWKQKQLRNNISIMGVPHVNDEITAEVAIDVFQALNCNIKPVEIESAHRTKQMNGKPGIIIVTFSNFDCKMEVLEAKSKKTVKVKDIVECSGPIANQFVYVNNHVTPFFGKLLFDGRQAVKNDKAFSCWYAATGCNIKFEENGKPLVYKNINELNVLIEKYAGKQTSTIKKRAITIDEPKSSTTVKSTKTKPSSKPANNRTQNRTSNKNSD